MMKKRGGGMINKMRGGGSAGNPAKARKGKCKKWLPRELLLSILVLIELLNVLMHVVVNL